jgi:DNA-binding MarR family transcriptional regulator
MRGDLRLRRLEEITLGEIGPSDAFALVRELLAEDATKFARGVYLALQEVVWRLVSDRTPGAETAQWLDVCGRASVLMRRGGAEAVAHQVAALSDLVGRTARFFEAQPVDEVLGRRHVAAVLRLLAGNAGPTSRAAVLEATGLGQSNLSRMLTMLEGHGLVRRDRSGREAELYLTEAGKAAVAKLAGKGRDVHPEAVWQAHGIGICVLTDDGIPSAANPGFEEAVGAPAEVAAASVSRGSGPADVRTADRRWARRVEIGEVDGGTASVWVDVSDLHLALAEAEMRIATGEAKVAGLREALAKAEASAAAAEKRLRRQQLSVEVVRERAVGRLGSMARLVHAGASGKARAAHRSDERPYRQIVAIKEALDNLLDVRMLSPRYHLHNRLDGRTIFEDVVKSTYALTNAKVAVEYPEWLRTEKADYVALVEPLSHFLLTTCGAVELSIDRDDRNVVVHGVGHPYRECSGSGTGPFTAIEAAAMDAFAEAWAQPGVEVRLTGLQSHDRGVEFRMSVPRGVEHAREAMD